MDTILLAFAFGTIWFYIASAITFFTIMALSENDHEIMAIFVLIAFIILMENSGAINLLADPLVLLKWTVTYFVVGAGWSFLKWFSFLHQQADLFKILRMDFLQKASKGKLKRKGYQETIENSADLVPEVINEHSKVHEKLKSDFRYYLVDKHYVNYDSDLDNGYAPLVKMYKYDITTWIIWWPTSAAWTIMSDPMVRIANWIFGILRGMYQALSNRVFNKFE